jgi:hypothetical protein
VGELGWRECLVLVAGWCWVGFVVCLVSVARFVVAEAAVLFVVDARASWRE